MRGFERQNKVPAVMDKALYKGNAIAETSVLLETESGMGFLLGHELNNHLTPLLGMAQLLSAMAAERSDPKIVELSGDVYQSARQLAGFVEQMRRIRSLELGWEEVTFRRADVTELIDNVIANLRPEATAAGVEVAFKSHGDDCETDFDFDLMPRAVEALLRNAVEHAGATAGELNRSVEVELFVENDTITLGIRNGGTPLPPDRLDTFFRPFNTDRRHKRNGAGLGTTYAKLVVETHGGRIAVSSTDATGTYVWFTIPRIRGATARTT